MITYQFIRTPVDLGRSMRLKDIHAFPPPGREGQGPEGLNNWSLGVLSGEIALTLPNFLLSYVMKEVIH